MSVGERIISLRTASSLSQGQLAERMGVSRQAVSKWENGAERPLRKYRVKLVKILDCSEDDLLE